MILPRRGRIAWNSRWRPPSAEPPAESPSTRYSSHLSTSRLEQSRSLPGRPPPERAPLRSRISSFCLRAATRASAASRPLLQIALGGLGVLLEELAEVLAEERVDDAFDFAVAELGFGLAFELRMGDAATDDGGEAFAEVFAGGDEVLEDAGVLAVVVDRAGERGAEAGEVRAAFGGVDVVDVGVDVLGVLGRVLQGDLDADAVVLAFDVEDVGVDRLAGAVEVLDVLAEAVVRTGTTRARRCGRRRS